MRSIVQILAAILVPAIAAAADQGGSAPLRQANSANGRFQLRIRPGRPGDNALRGCKAGLYQRDGGNSSRGQLRWERFLVNDVAPGRAFIRDDGRFVITLDEHNRGGARNALVIYGERGELLRHFLLPDLLGQADWTNVQKAGESLFWLDGARFEFRQSPPQFVITLRRGCEIAVDLHKLQVLPQSGRSAGASTIPPQISELLFGPRPEQAAAGDMAPKASARDQQAAPPGNEENPSEEELTGEPEEHAPRVSEDEGVVADHAPDEIGEHAAKAGASDTSQSTGEDAGTHIARVNAELLDEMAEADLPAEMPPEISEPGGVPRPDPAAPVDYLAWANSLTTTDGLSAVPEYQAAFDAFKICDSELYDGALAGDPEALNSPGIQAWLAENQAALEHWRNALELDYQGWPMKSADGSLIGALLPQLSSMRQLGKAAILEGRYFAMSGRPDAAVDNYTDVLTAGTQAGAGLCLIETLVGTAVQSLGAGSLLDLEASPAGDQLDYAALAARLADNPTRSPSPERAMQFERAAFMDTAQRLSSVDEAGGGDVFDPAKVAEFLDLVDQDADPQKVAAETDRIAALSFEQTVDDANAFYDAVGAAISRPFPEAQQSLAEIERQFEDGAANPLLSKMTASMQWYHRLLTRNDAIQRATRLATELGAYRQVYGDYPESLDVFGSEDFAVDPFTTRTFIYRRTDDGFTLYSAGENGVDDGGQHNPRGDTGDIVYWPRPRRANGR